MKFPALILSFMLLFSCMEIPVCAATMPLIDNPKKLASPEYKSIATMKLKDFQKLIGRKLTLKEKIAFFVFKHKMRHQHGDGVTQGKTSFILGLVGLIFLAMGFAVPVLFFGALVLSILAIVTGSTASRKDSDNREARMGKLLGWITLGVLSLLAILIIVLVATWAGN
jgi:hypothetical protein